jgi:hypothetical protein
VLPQPLVYNEEINFECKNEFPIDADCKQISCHMKKVGITKFVIDPYIRPNFDPEALIQAFLSSVLQTDGVWEPVVRRSVNRCFDDFTGAVDGFICDQTMPAILLEVIVCTYKENFLRCPTWNPDKLEICEFTQDFVSKCTP